MLGLGFCTTLAGFFGMNIVHGLESQPYAFLTVVSGSIGMALVLQQMIMRVVGNSSTIDKVKSESDPFISDKMNNIVGNYLDAYTFDRNISQRGDGSTVC